MAWPDEEEGEEAEIKSAAPAHDLAEVWSIQELEARWEEKKERWKELAAIHGPGGKYDDLRKTVLAAYVLRCSEKTRGPTDPPLPDRITDKTVDAWAHAHPTYMKFVHNCKDDHAEYVALALDMMFTEAKLYRSNAVLKMAHRESMHPRNSI